MSGPKISEYGLSEEQKSILQAQWRCYRQIMSSLHNVSSIVADLKKRKSDLSALQLQLAALTADGEIATELDAVIQMFDAACAEFKAQAAAQKPQMLKRYKLNQKTLETYREQQALAKTLQRETLAFEQRVNAAVDAAQNAVTQHQNALYGDILQALEPDAPQAPSKAKPTICHKSLNFTGLHIPQLGTEPETPDMAQLKAALNAKLEPYHNSTVLPAELKTQALKAQTKLNAIRDFAFLKNFYAVTLKPLLVECATALDAHKTISAEYRTLYSNYMVLCQTLDVSAESVPCTMDGLNTLKQNIEALEAEVLQNAEQAYICDTIDEVMAAMGYELLGHKQVAKKSGKRFKHELYTFDEGTAVNITYADNGQITMELGGLDYADRTPDAAETQKLCREMESFCREFPAIEKQLAARGVTVKHRIELAPPAPEHAAIINLSDYERIGSKPVQTFKAATKTTGAAPQKKHRGLDGDA